jgi:hypothetical protein
MLHLDVEWDNVTKIIYFVDSSRLVRIHSVGMRNNAFLFDQSIIRK